MRTKQKRRKKQRRLRERHDKRTEFSSYSLSYFKYICVNTLVKAQVTENQFKENIAKPSTVKKKFSQNLPIQVS